MNKHFALVAWMAGWVSFCAAENLPRLPLFNLFFTENFNQFDATNYAIKPAFLTTTCTPSSLGLMDKSIKNGCVTNSLSIDYNDFGEKIELDHVRSFVLHTSTTASLGTVIFEQNSTNFAFLPALMSAGQTYYISPVAGPKNVDGLADLTDACLTVGVGQPVIFHSPPVGIWATDGAFCAGDSVQLSVLLFGESPFSIHVFDNFLGKIDTFSTSESPFNFNVKHSLSTSYTLLKIKNDFCESTPGTPVYVKTGQPASAIFSTKNLKICKKNNPNLSTFINFSHTISAGDTTGTWLDLDNSAALGQFPIVEVTHVPLGKYRFQYTTAAAIAPCADSSYVIEVEFADCYCPALSIDSLPNICQTSAQINLQKFTENYAGFWKIINQPFGSTASLIDSIFDATNSLSGSYKLSFLFKNVPANVCAMADTIHLEVAKTIEAGQQTLPFLGKCAKSSTPIFLENALENASAAGFWTANSPTDLPFLNKFTGKISVENMEIGTHFFTKKIIAAAPCPSDSAVVRLEIFENPTANAGFDGQLDCFHSTILLGSAMPDSLLFSWSNPNFGDVSTVETSDAGDYFLTVTNQSTGCFSTDAARILPDAGRPIFSNIFQKNPSCFGENSGEIRVDSIAGGVAPLLYSIDNQPVSSDFLFKNLKSGVFQLTVQDVLGCETDTILELLEPAKLTLFAGSDTLLLLGDSIQLLPISSFTPANFVWSGSGNFCQNCWSSMIAPTVDGNFILTAFDSSGCHAAAHFSVEIRRDFALYFPNILLPSNKIGGSNDQFFPQGEANGGFQILELSIRSRWGDLVFFSKKMPLNDPIFGWDGRVRGKIAAAGVYLWEAKLQLSDGSFLKKTGDLSVIR